MVDDVTQRNEGAERAREESERAREESERVNAKLAAKLRELGIDPDSLS
jgi:hypothetical protein